MPTPHCDCIYLLTVLMQRKNMTVIGKLIMYLTVQITFLHFDSGIVLLIPAVEYLHRYGDLGLSY